MNTLTLTEVTLVLREIELKRQFDSDCDDSGQEQSDDDCEEFEVGPLLLQLPLDLASWFRFPGTTDLIDSITANKGGANEDLVEGTIKNSIDAFEDDDGDGHR